jgi:hypothetical protein
MQIAKNTVVTLMFELMDAQGNLIEKTEEPIAYLHGGYHGIFPLVEQALDGKAAGDSCEVRLAPNDAFGEYDAELVHVEARDKFPPEVAVGMQFEGRGESSGQGISLHGFRGACGHRRGTGARPCPWSSWSSSLIGAVRTVLCQMSVVKIINKNNNLTVIVRFIPHQMA